MHLSKEIAAVALPTAASGIGDFDIAPFLPARRTWRRIYQVGPHVLLRTVSVLLKDVAANVSCVFYLVLIVLLFR